MPRLEVPGASLYYETDGSPDHPALLLIHAGIATLRMWDPQIATLSKDHFVVRFDGRGFGQTDAESTEFSNRADALAVLDRLGIERVTVIGCSLGGGIAIDLTLDSPDRVAGLVTIGSGPSGHPNIEETAHEHELYAAMESATGEEALRLEADFWDVGPLRDAASLDQGFVATARGLNLANLRHIDENLRGAPLEPPAYGRLGDIRVPTLVMVGEYDVSVFHPVSRSLLERIPGAEEYRFADAAHIPNVEQPAEFERVLTKWLERHSL
jgi:pimeloyl-ACP methyl ester carboxylesterase